MVTDIFNAENRLFALARQGRLPSALTAIAVAFFALLLALIPGQILGRIVLVSHDGTPRFRSGIQSLAEPIVQNVAMFTPHVGRLVGVPAAFQQASFLDAGIGTLSSTPARPAGGRSLRQQ